MRNLSNINGTQSVGPYPIDSSSQPLAHSVLVYEDGQWKYEQIAQGGGIAGVTTVGTGLTIDAGIINNILHLKSLKGNNQITLTALQDEIGFSLNSTLQFSTDETIFLTDGGGEQLINLYFQCRYGVLTSTPLSINNQGKIDFNSPPYLNAISDGTPFNSKFLALDNTNKLITAIPTDQTSGTNIGDIGFGIYNGKVGNELQFRKIAPSDNINIGVVSGSFYFNLDQDINELRNINGNLPRSPGILTYNANNADINFGSENIYFNNLEIVNQNKFLGIDTNGKIEKRFAIEDVKPSLSTEVSLVEGNVDYTSYIKRLKAGTNTNITSTTTEVTLNVDTNLNNISSINSITPLVNLAIDSTNIAFPQIPNNPALIATKGLYIDEVTKNIFYDNTVKTLTTSNVGQLLLSPLSTSEYPILRGLQAGNGIAITNSDNVLNIINTGTVANTIYTADSQLTDDLRVISGKTPGSTNNKIAFNDVNLNLTNNIAYNQEHMGLIDTPNMLAFSDGGSYSKFITSIQNHLSTICYFNHDPTYGNKTNFYQSYCDNITGNKAWLFQVEIYEKGPINNTFCASFEFNVNSQVTDTYYIKPKRTTLLNNASPQEVIGLEISKIFNGPNPGWNLALVSLGLGLTGVTREYMCKVFDKGPATGKYAYTVFSSAISTPSQNYLENFQFLYYSGLGPWPNTLVYYNRPGCDLQITVLGQVQNSSNTVGTLEIRMNGVAVYIINTRTGNGNSTVPVHGSKRIKFVELLNSGAISLQNPITVSFFATGAGSNFSGAPFVLDMQYV